MIQKDDVIGCGSALGDGLFSAQAGIYLDPIVSQNSLCDHEVHLFIIHRQGSDSNAGKGLPARSLVLREPAFPHLAVQQIRHGKGGKRLMYHKQTAFSAQREIPLCDHDNTERIRQLLVILPVLIILRLGNEHMGQLVAAPQFEQSLKIMRLVSLDAKPMHQIIDQPVVISPDLITDISFRPEIAGYTQLFRVIEHDAWPFIHNPLGNHDMGGQSLPFLAVEMDKTAHGGQKSLRDREAKAEPSRKTAAPGIRLIKDIIHLCQLRIGHADAGVTDINDQIGAVILLAVLDTDIHAALFRKLDGIFHQDFEYMGNLFRVADKGRRHIGVYIKHQLQMLPVGLQRDRCDHIVQHRGDHIFFFGRGQRAFQDLRIVQHIVNLVGQALSRQLYG